MAIKKRDAKISTPEKLIFNDLSGVDIIKLVENEIDRQILENNNLSYITITLSGCFKNNTIFNHLFSSYVKVPIKLKESIQ